MLGTKLLDNALVKTRNSFTANFSNSSDFFLITSELIN